MLIVYPNSGFYQVFLF